MRRIFILLPALLPTGPVKGALALANALAADREIKVVTLKKGTGAAAPLDPSVEQLCLQSHGGMRAKVRAYRALLAQAGGRAHVASISFCLSADAVNLFCRSNALTCASVRANLIRNYGTDYGPIGVPLAAMHLASLRACDHIVAMTHAMARQIARYAGRRPVVIGNFVDEAALEPFRTTPVSAGPLRFVFLGSLNARKQPLLLLRCISELRRRGHDAQLDILGSGPLLGSLKDHLASMDLADAVRVHGFQPDPYPTLASADALVLPSVSEGLSRACLEALYLGVPCVLRAADGNGELITSGYNGSLFDRDVELPRAMLEAAELSRRQRSRSESLLPPAFRQHEAADQYATLVEQGVSAGDSASSHGTANCRG
jgi:glycosyltransferase involved in cell wall biosynthesis